MKKREGSFVTGIATDDKKCAKRVLNSLFLMLTYVFLFYVLCNRRLLTLEADNYAEEQATMAATGKIHMTKEINRIQF